MGMENKYNNPYGEDAFSEMENMRSTEAFLDDVSNEGTKNKPEDIQALYNAKLGKLFEKISIFGTYTESKKQEQKLQHEVDAISNREIPATYQDFQKKLAQLMYAQQFINQIEHDPRIPTNELAEAKNLLEELIEKKAQIEQLVEVNGSVTKPFGNLN